MCNSIFHDGYEQACRNINNMNKKELVKYLNTQYGVPSWVNTDDEFQIRQEAFEQCCIDFYKKSFKEAYGGIKTHWSKLLKEQNK